MASLPYPDLHLNVRQGEIKAVIGANGAGKTTLFNVIAGVTPPSNGSVTFSGLDITSLPPFRRAQARHQPHVSEPTDFQGYDRAGECDGRLIMCHTASGTFQAPRSEAQHPGGRNVISAPLAFNRSTGFGLADKAAQLARRIELW